MGRGAKAAAIVGVAAVSTFVAMPFTVVVLILAHRAGPAPPQTWRSPLAAAGVLGAAVGGIVTSLVLRCQARLHAKPAPPIGQLSDCILPRRLE